MPVPPKAELKILDRANMVTSRVPKEISESTSMLGDHSPLGPALFSKLVPYSVHLAASAYVDRRDRLINNTIIEELEILTTKIHEWVYKRSCLVQPLTLEQDVTEFESAGVSSGS